MREIIASSNGSGKACTARHTRNVDAVDAAGARRREDGIAQYTRAAQGICTQMGEAMVRTALALIGVILLVPPGQALARPSGGHTALLDALFRVDTLNSSREYIEHMTGPAKYTADSAGASALSVRTYVISNCVVEIGYKDDKVSFLGLKGITQACAFPLARFIPHLPTVHLPPLAELTFGAFERDVGAGIDPNRYVVECLGDCGNSADPSVALLHTGAHVDQFIDIIIEEDYPYADKNSGQALSRLGDVIIKQESRDYGVEGRITCDRRYQALEKELFKAARVKNVYVGMDLESRLRACGR
jgi:hypothetical protein